MDHLVYDESNDTVILYDSDGRTDTFTNAGATGVGPFTMAGYFFDFLRYGDGESIHLRGTHGSMTLYQPVTLNEDGDPLYAPITITDRFGNQITHTYDDDGKLTRIDGDRSGTSDHYLTFTWNGDGRISKIADYADYSSDSSLIGGSFTGAREWEFEYDVDGHLVTVLYPKTESYYSASTGANARTRVEFTYDANDRLIEAFDARQAGSASSYGWLKNHYDGSSRVNAQDIGRTSSGDTTHRHHIVYGGSGVVDCITPLGYRTRHEMNGNGCPISLRHYTGQWNSSLTQTGAKVRTGDPTYYEYEFDYDSEYNLIEVEAPLGNSTEALYSHNSGDQRSRGNLLRVLRRPDAGRASTLPANQQYGLLSTYEYASAADFNLLATVVSPRAYEVASGWQIDDALPTPNDATEFSTEYVYNGYASGYGPRGSLRSITTPTIDGTLSPGTLNSGQSITVEYEHNSAGQLLQVEDGAGVQIAYTYGATGDAYGYLVEVEEGAQSAQPLSVAFAYNSVGALKQSTDARNYTWTRYLNQLDQVVQTDTPPVTYHGNAVISGAFTYDLNGNQTQATFDNLDRNGIAAYPATISTTWTYNAMDLVATVVEPISTGISATTTFDYDLDYRSVLTTLPEGNQSAVDYDELGRTYKTYWGFNTTNVAKASALEIMEYDYDANSNLVSSTNGLGDDDLVTYDSYDRVVEVEDRPASNPNTNTFVYNRSGQLTKAIYNAESINLSSINWTNVENNNLDHTDRHIFSRRRSGTIDRANWYRALSTPSSQPDGSVGPHQTTTYNTDEDESKDPSNPLATGAGSRLEYGEIGQVELGYDFNNNLIEDATRTFNYNFRDELRRVTRKSDGDDVATYRSDALGRRVMTVAAWEVAAKKRFDTRFELDVNMDADADSTPMAWVDGGVSAGNIPISDMHESQWLAKIDPNDFVEQEYYADHAVLIPADLGANYLGYFV